MKETRIIMGMPVTVVIADASATRDALEKIFDFMIATDERFSTYKSTSEISRINSGDIKEGEYSPEMREIFALAEQTKQETNGYFDIAKADGSLDPSGVVKGRAIQRAAGLLTQSGYTNFYVDAGGDIQSRGVNEQGEAWSVGIRNPFNHDEIVKVIYPQGAGVATSGTYIRGQHIYNPHMREKELHDMVSLSVVAPNVLEADRFATAAFAMGKEGINFIEQLPGFEGYAIDPLGRATMTSGFNRYTKSA
jgi:thiamine biosynthesis lipoprotein